MVKRVKVELMFPLLAGEGQGEVGNWNILTNPHLNLLSFKWGGGMVV